MENETNEEFYEEAEDLVKDPDKLEKMLQKLEKKLEVVPVAGTALSNVPLMISLVRSYIKKEYTEIPLASVISIVMALAYVLSPVDIIPDMLPGGYTDDAVIILGCLALIKTDLEDYRLWRSENGKVIEMPNYEEIDNIAKEHDKTLNAFFRGRKSKK